ncbi:P-II family nitrogen regulator [Methanogenium organophilum]|uniref:P-II family nitrogen regulator n=1 Tax=Methanogenium organophilum TaxID=2199 RepID=A0A9X9T851_METOG|nr:P-II family nitrogen regulator [Methanogenium organophilum]WAI00807.1 P-II family nitrogen regulator [Methanogenium organophilum]
MKKIEAIIRPEKLEDVKAALDEGGHFAMTVTNVHGRGAQRGISLQFRGRKVNVDLIPKVKVEMVVEDDEVAEITQIIRRVAVTGEAGDGKIFIIPIEMSIPVRDKA